MKLGTLSFNHAFFEQNKPGLQQMLTAIGFSQTNNYHTKDKDWIYLTGVSPFFAETTENNPTRYHATFDSKFNVCLKKCVDENEEVISVPRQFTSLPKEIESHTMKYLIHLSTKILESDCAHSQRIYFIVKEEPHDKGASLYLQQKGECPDGEKFEIFAKDMIGHPYQDSAGTFHLWVPSTEDDIQRGRAQLQQLVIEHLHSQITRYTNLLRKFSTLSSEEKENLL